MQNRSEREAGGGTRKYEATNMSRCGFRAGLWREEREYVMRERDVVEIEKGFVYHVYASEAKRPATRSVALTANLPAALPFGSVGATGPV